MSEDPVIPITSSSSHEDLLSRHRKEARDLQARITQKKKQATKKTRKGVNSDCEALERDLRERHTREIAELENPIVAAAEEVEPAEDNEEIPNGDSLSVAEEKPPAEGAGQGPKKRNRQKERLARRAAEMAAVSEAAAAEAAALPDHREDERSTMVALLKQHNLKERLILPDGHCLYSAFADQLKATGIEDGLDYKVARKRCAEFMKAHREDFEPFLEDPFDEHVRKIEETAVWGGQTEVMALGRAFGVRVNILQAEGRIEEMGEGEDGKEVWLGYYRHSFGLGEHYNSLRKMAPAE